jgi:hypothetical protein
VRAEGLVFLLLRDNHSQQVRAEGLVFLLLRDNHSLQLRAKEGTSSGRGISGLENRSTNTVRV